MAEPRKPDSRGLNFFDITDFSPGVYDNSNTTTTNPATPLISPGIFPAPPGAADGSQTYGCIPEPNGGLGPGPGLTSTFRLVDMDNLLTSGLATDITCLTNSFQSSADELVIGVNTVTASISSQTTTFYSYVVGTNTLQLIQTATYNWAAGQENFCAYPFTTVIDQSSTIQPVVVLPLTAPDGPTSALMTYPNPASPTAFGVSTVTSHRPGSSFGHQGRIVGIQVNNAYGWPTSVTEFPNEAFDYTDPPQTETWPSQFEIFGPENPFGYGAVTSVSAGELFCVKRRGGAIIIQGDLNNPTVTSLPGVKSTGIIYGRTDTDPNGSYYCASFGGAWLWNGGNTSQKISRQLDDNFFTPTNPIPGCSYYGYYCQRWGEWMLFSNNWLYDTIHNSWWRLSNPAVRSYFWYVPGYDQRLMYAATPTAANDHTDFMDVYNRGAPTNNYQWQSLPIKIPQEDRTSTARELVIRASNPYGDAVPQIGATLIDDKGNQIGLDTWNMTTGINTVQETRLNAALKQTTTVAVRLVCAGTTAAPVVHGLSMGYRTREHAGIT